MTALATMAAAMTVHMLRRDSAVSRPLRGCCCSGVAPSVADSGTASARPLGGGAASASAAAATGAAAGSSAGGGGATNSGHGCAACGLCGSATLFERQSCSCTDGDPGVELGPRARRIAQIESTVAGGARTARSDAKVTDDASLKSAGARASAWLRATQGWTPPPGATATRTRGCAYTGGGAASADTSAPATTRFRRNSQPAKRAAVPRLTCSTPRAGMTSRLSSKMHCSKPTVLVSLAGGAVAPPPRRTAAPLPPFRLRNTQPARERARRRGRNVRRGRGGGKAQWRGERTRGVDARGHAVGAVDGHRRLRLQEAVGRALYGDALQPERAARAMDEAAAQAAGRRGGDEVEVGQDDVAVEDARTKERPRERDDTLPRAQRARDGRRRRAVALRARPRVDQLGRRGQRHSALARKRTRRNCQLARKTTRQGDQHSGAHPQDLPAQAWMERGGGQGGGRWEGGEVEVCVDDDVPRAALIDGRHEVLRRAHVHDVLQRAGVVLAYLVLVGRWEGRVGGGGDQRARRHGRDGAGRARLAGVRV